MSFVARCLMMMMTLFRTGKVRSKVVPETVLSVLPCSAPINTTLAQFGSQYLRKCENRAVGIARTRQILR